MLRKAMLFPIIFICQFVFALAAENQTLTDVVKTKLGKVQGFTVTAESGFKTDVFLGIPFAQPPVGELRFEKPRPAQPWNGVLATTEFANVCTSVVSFLAWGGKALLDYTSAPSRNYLVRKAKDVCIRSSH
ncbi:carboxylesterase family domain-containing protein [Ditylenchus destructor]|uniref:Carboxylesterase family domain-containing protein n=1 Tax=Ditylenchus destructor TaxID=166010 RepID=A0AAD4QW75_9BILA|nr:carboxylesterase family domain-containing protein [Ditylenchus destructor]